MTAPPDFKRALYRDYVSTHLEHRKGTPSVQKFARAARTWDRLFGPFLPADRGARAVDVGCGAGSIVWWLQQRGFARAEGIEINAELVATAARLGVANVREADAQTFLAANPSAYRLIIMRDVLEHFDRPAILDLLGLARAALVPGGRLVLQVPNAGSPFFGRIRYGDFTHEVAFAASSLQQVLRASGFTEVTTHPVAPARDGGARSWRQVLAWRVAERIYRFLLAAEGGGRNAIVTQNIIASALRPDAPQ